MSVLPLKYQHIWAWLDQISEQYCDQIAYSSFGQHLSYKQLKDKSLQLCNFLKYSGIKPHDRVAIMLPNCLQQPISTFGVIASGAIAVNVNPLYTANELKHQLNDSGATSIIVLANMAHIIDQIKHETPLKHIIVTHIGDELPWYKSWIMHIVLKYFKKVIPPFDSDHVQWHQCFNMPICKNPHQPKPDDIVLLQYTGGTTGLAKGVMLSHRNLLSNLVQIPSSMPEKLYQNGHNTILTALPLYHIFALMVSWVTLDHGGLNLLVANPRDLNALVEILKRNKVHGIPLLETLMLKLLQHPSFKDINFNHLVATITGGMATQPSTAKKWQRQTGCVVQQGYGLSETSPVISISQNKHSFEDHVGKSLTMTEIMIMDSHKQSLPPDQIGEIWVKGPQVTRGYWQNDKETNEVFEGHWFRTGDLGFIDQSGCLSIVDRLKDMIIISGFNVYPSEIENILTKHANIEEACVVGEKHKHTEAEYIIAYYVSSKKLTAESLKAFCKQYLSAYKIPNRFIRTQEIPKSVIGKILRRSLKQA
ncbi:MAG: AMP-binding protein [Candidatus Comchoanobacterales bacterium]